MPRDYGAEVAGEVAEGMAAEDVELETADLYAALGDVAGLLDIARTLTTSAQSARDRMAAILYLRGESLRAVASGSGISLQRVHQIARSLEVTGEERGEDGGEGGAVDTGEGDDDTAHPTTTGRGNLERLTTEEGGYGDDWR